MGQGSRATSPVSATEEPIVYVIDDDPLMLGALSMLFRSIDLRVDAFASATEFLQHNLPPVPSCLVLDIRLPRLSGFDLQVELGRRGHPSGVAVTIAVQGPAHVPSIDRRHHCHRVRDRTLDLRDRTAVRGTKDSAPIRSTVSSKADFASGAASRQPSVSITASRAGFRASGGLDGPLSPAKPGSVQPGASTEVARKSPVRVRMQRLGVNSGRLYPPDGDGARRRGSCFEQDGRGRTRNCFGLLERGSSPDAEPRGPARNAGAIATWWAAAGSGRPSAHQ